LIQHLLVRENVIVFAGARDPTSATALNELANQHQGQLHVVKLLSADEANNRVVVENIKRIAGRLDVVIANAGILKNPSTVLATSQENMLQHFTVNVVGPMMLIQATHPLLKASTSTPDQQRKWEHCHRLGLPDGPAGGVWDLRSSVELADEEVVDRESMMVLLA
jgi:NAD(P)-dependent dehydrogenase (short-subunit alcohol dehydrogenase family)